MYERWAGVLRDWGTESCCDLGGAVAAETAFSKM